MSTNSSLLVFYGSNSMVTGDNVSTGGAPQLGYRIGFSDITAGQAIWASSSSSDTGVSGTIFGRNAAGVIQSESHTFNGTTPVTGSLLWQRLLYSSISVSAAVGDLAIYASGATVQGTAQGAAVTSGAVGPYITLQSGQGASCSIDQIVQILNNNPSGAQFQLRRIVSLSGDTAYVNRDWSTTPTSSTTYQVVSGMLFEESPNAITGIYRAFINCQAAAAGEGTTTYYAKVFAVNNSTTTALTNASIGLVSTTPALPGSSAIQMGLASGLDDTTTIANRQTAPSSITFTTGSLPVSSGVANATGLPQGTAPNTAGAQAVWLQLTIPAGTAPYDGFASLTISGSTT